MKINYYLIFIILLFILLLFIYKTNVRILYHDIIYNFITCRHILPDNNDVVNLNNYERPYKLKIAILTNETRKGEYILLHHQNLEEYSKMYGYHYYNTSTQPKEKNVSIYSYKFILLLKLLESPENYDYVIWLDSDTLIIDKKRSLENIIYQCQEKDLIIGNEIEPKNIHILNAGIFFIKNSKIGIQFLYDCLDYLNENPYCIVNGLQNGQFAKSCYEQGIMNILIKNNLYYQYAHLDNNYFIINGGDHNHILNKKYKNPWIIHVTRDEDKRNKIFKSLF
jgi:hypothetical protein